MVGFGTGGQSNVKSNAVKPVLKSIQTSVYQDAYNAGVKRFSAATSLGQLRLSYLKYKIKCHALNHFLDTTPFHVMEVTDYHQNRNPFNNGYLNGLIDGLLKSFPDASVQVEEVEYERHSRSLNYPTTYNKKDMLTLKLGRDE